MFALERDGTALVERGLVDELGVGDRLVDRRGLVGRQDGRQERKRVRAVRLPGRLRLVRWSVRVVEFLQGGESDSGSLVSR